MAVIDLNKAFHEQDTAALAELTTEQRVEQLAARQLLYKYVNAIWDRTKQRGLSPAVGVRVPLQSQVRAKIQRSACPRNSVPLAIDPPVPCQRLLAVTGAQSTRRPDSGKIRTIWA
jgi:hypothetical protein